MRSSENITEISTAKSTSAQTFTHFLMHDTPKHLALYQDVMAVIVTSSFKFSSVSIKPWKQQLQSTFLDSSEKKYSFKRMKSF